MGFLNKTVIQRLTGERPSRLRAVIAALIVAVAAGVSAYRLLRARSDGGDES